VEQHLFLIAVLLPAAVATCAAVLLRRVAPRLVGLALATACVMSARAQDHFGGLPPSNGWMWLPVVVLLIAVVGAAAGDRATGRQGRGIACVVIGLIASLLLPWPEWRTAESRLLLGVAIAGCSALLLPLGMHRGNFSWWCAVSLGLVAPSVLSLATGFAKLAVTIGGVSCACGWIGVAAVLTRPRHRLHAGIAGTMVLACVSVIGSAAAFAFDTSGMPAWVFMLAAVAPLGAWMGEAPPFRGSAMVSALARVSGSAMITAAVVWPCVPRLVPKEPGDAYALIDVARQPKDRGVPGSWTP
jgi:hypothetical protein